MIIGCARVSTQDQNPQLQLDTLNGAASSRSSTRPLRARSATGRSCRLPAGHRQGDQLAEALHRSLMAGLEHAHLARHQFRHTQREVDSDMGHHPVADERQAELS